MTAQLNIPLSSTPQDAKSIEGALQRTASIARRALSMDPDALIRFRPAAVEGATDVFISTPLHCVVSQRIAGTVTEETVAMAREVAPKLDTASPGEQLDLGMSMDFMWAGTLPPLEGFQVVDKIPAEEVRNAHATMGKENADASAPGGIARSLLEQEVVEVTSEENDERVALTGRHLAALGGLGVIAKPTAPELSEFDLLRVSVTASWIRIDALYGTIYSPRPGGLARVPSPR